jgi:type II secretory pathway pseudopilin PulG
MKPELAATFVGGFTFVELLAAMMFLAILVPVIIEGLTVANRASVVAERSALAAELGENKLNELTLDGAWTSTPATSGNFGQDYTGYRYQLNQSTWAMDNMTKLTVDVFYNVQGNERKVSLSTLVTTATNSQTSGSGSLSGLH